MKYPSRCRTAAGLVLLGAMALTACREEVTAIIGTDGAFSLYGVVSPDFDFQSVRVYPIEALLRPLPDEPLDAVVTSTDLHTGEAHVWRDSIIADAQDQYAHVFWSPFQAQRGHTYRIEVERSDGAMSRVDAVVPPDVSVELGRSRDSQGHVIQPYWIRGGAPRLLHAAIEYAVRPVILPLGSECWFAYDRITVPIPYSDPVKAASGDWLIEANLTLDFAPVRDSAGVAVIDELITSKGTLYVLLLDVQVLATVVAEDWYPPGGIFDPELLANPQLMTNVENGSGFVGAGYRLATNRIPEEAAYRRAGFLSVEDYLEKACGVPPDF